MVSRWADLLQGLKQILCGLVDDFSYCSCQLGGSHNMGDHETKNSGQPVILLFQRI